MNSYRIRIECGMWNVGAWLDSFVGFQKVFCKNERWEMNAYTQVKSSWFDEWKLGLVNYLEGNDWFYVTTIYVLSLTTSFLRNLLFQCVCHIRYHSCHLWNMDASLFVYLYLYTTVHIYVQLYTYVYSCIHMVTTKKHHGLVSSHNKTKQKLKDYNN